MADIQLGNKVEPFLPYVRNHLHYEASLNFSAHNDDTIKIMVFQTGDSNPVHVTSWIEKEISSTGRKPDFALFPECWLGGNGDVDLEKNSTLKEMADIMAHFGIYGILGSMRERDRNTGKMYTTSVLVGRNGEIIGSYRKRKPVNAYDGAGDKVGIFDTEFGRVAIMVSTQMILLISQICFDIENEDIFQETMSYKPHIIFNPVYISPPSTSPKYEDMVYSNWKTAMETMARKFETICKENNVTIIRCDFPMMSSSLTIGPYKSVYSPAIQDTYFTIYVEKQANIGNYLVGNPSERERTEKRDRSGNRYSIRPLFKNGSYGKPNPALAFIDQMKLLCASREQEASVELWNIHLRKKISTVKLPVHEQVTYIHSHDKTNPLLNQPGNTVTPCQRAIYVFTERSVIAFDPVNNTFSDSVLETSAGPLWNVASASTPNGLLLCTVHTSGAITMYQSDGQPPKLKQLQNISAFQDSPARSVAMSYHNDVLYIAVGSENGHIKIFHATSGKLVSDWIAHQQCVSSLSFFNDLSDDSKSWKLLSTSYDGTIKTWNHPTEASPLEQVYQYQPGSVSAVSDAFVVPNTCKVIASSYDFTMKMIDLKIHNGTDASQYYYHTIYGHSAPVLQIRSSPDGIRLVTSCVDGNTFLWQFEQDQVPVQIQKIIK